MCYGGLGLKLGANDIKYKISFAQLSQSQRKFPTIIGKQMNGCVYILCISLYVSWDKSLLLGQSQHLHFPLLY